MSLNRIIPSEELDDILFELAASEHLDPEEVRATIARHPEFAREILEFAAEWIEADALAGTGRGEAERSASAFEPDLAQFWAEASGQESDPFAGVKPATLQAIAGECELHVTILMQLCRRMIDTATVPLGLVESIAARLGKPPRLLSAFLEGPQLAGAIEYKSLQGRPKLAEKISFAEAVRNSPMADSMKARWLSPGED